MLRPDSPELISNPYGAVDVFAYPLPYEETDLLEDAGPYAPDATYQDYKPIGTTPEQLTLGWFRSNPGRIQSGQTCRYDAVHRRLAMPVELGIPEDSDEAHQIRLNVLSLLAIHVGSDLHPVGHMAKTLGKLDEVLFEREFNRPHDDARAMALNRFGAATHDVTETLYPAVPLYLGAALGDIESGGKTEADEALEKDIAAHIYANNPIFRQALAPDFRLDLVRFIRHDVNNLPDNASRIHHEVSEIVHRTAFLENASGIYAASGDLSIELPFEVRRILFGLCETIFNNQIPKLRTHLQGVPELESYVAHQADRLQAHIENTQYY